jgi:hypothetical protein
MEINSTSQRQRKFTSRSAMYVLATQEARCARVASCVRDARCKGGDHGYLGALQHTAEAGCQLCSRLAADVDAPLAAEYDLAILSRSSLPWLELRLRDRPERSFQFQFRDGDPMVSLNTTLRYSRTDAPSIFDLAKSWIHCCQATHTGCRERREQQGRQSTSPGSLFTPTRLVHVQGAGNELSLVQLTATAELDGQP